MQVDEQMSRRGYTAQRGRCHRHDGTWFQWAVVTCPQEAPIQFGSAFGLPLPEQLHTMAHMRLLKARQRGVEDPVVVVWNSYNHADPWTRGLRLRSVPAQTLVHASRHSYVQQTLRDVFRTGRWQWDGEVLRGTKDLDADSRLLLSCLQEAGQLLVAAWNGPVTTAKLANVDPDKDIVGLGPFALPSLVAAHVQAAVAFNTSFFVLEEQDFFSEFSRLGDGYGLHIHGGEMFSLPLFRRTAIFVDEQGHKSMKALGIQDCLVQWHEVQFDLGTFALNEPGEFAIYTRRYGLDQGKALLSTTPKRPGGLDLIVINRAVVGLKRGGGVVIPQNGFVLSVPETAVPEDQILDRVLHYQVRGEEVYREAMQAGPRLVQNAEAVARPGLLQQEEFHRKDTSISGPDGYGVLPTDFAMDVDVTRAARTALGWNRNGQWQVLAVESANQGIDETGESSGCTLAEVAELALGLGFADAVNLDGGGSTNLQFFGTHLIKPADRRGMPGAIFERPVPLIGCIGADYA